MSESSPTIQFISAEELRNLAEMERDERNARSITGMIDEIDRAQRFIDDAMAKADRPSLMVQWALDEPGDFFKLKAKLLGANKQNNPTVKIQIGLPMTQLDALPDESHLGGDYDGQTEA